MAEDQERTEDRERLEKLMSRLESYLLSLEQMRLREYIHFLGDRKRLMRSHFWGGVARGLGMAVGFTILGAMLGYSLGTMNPTLLCVSLSFAAGAMLYVIFGELLPESEHLWQHKLSGLATMLGLLLGLALIFSHHH